MNNLKIFIFTSFLLLSQNVLAQKIDSTKLQSAIKDANQLIETDSRQFFKNVESLIVWHSGDIIFEMYYNNYNKDSLHHIQSQTKSIIALILGIAIDNGFVDSENEKIASYFPQFFKPDDSLKMQITLRDLLTMSSGIEWEEMIPYNDPGNDNANMYNSSKYLEYVLSRPMDHQPYSVFNYNSGSPMIVGSIIEKTSQMPLDKFAEKYLFAPLGITDYYWLKDTTGFCHCGGGLFLKPADMVKIGAMMLSGGKWKNKPVVSENWIKKMTLPYFNTSFDNAGYGYFWWIREMRNSAGISTMMISAEGAGGQNLFLFPAYNLIVAFTESNYTTPQVNRLFIRESILPLLE